MVGFIIWFQRHRSGEVRHMAPSKLIWPVGYPSSSPFNVRDPDIAHKCETLGICVWRAGLNSTRLLKTILPLSMLSISTVISFSHHQAVVYTEQYPWELKQVLVAVCNVMDTSLVTMSLIALPDANPLWIREEKLGSGNHLSVVVEILPPYLEYQFSWF